MCHPVPRVWLRCFRRGKHTRGVAEEEEGCWVVLPSLWMETLGGFAEGPWGCVGTPNGLPSQERVLGLSWGA